MRLSLEKVMSLQCGSAAELVCFLGNLPNPNYHILLIIPEPLNNRIEAKSGLNQSNHVTCDLITSKFSIIQSLLINTNFTVKR